MKTAYLHGRTYQNDGTSHSHWTVKVEAKDAPLWWQEKGLSYTATGYGRRIPTPHMVRFNGKWRRVYCCVYSNSGTCYIGKLPRGAGEMITVQEGDE